VSIDSTVKWVSEKYRFDMGSSPGEKYGLLQVTSTTALS